MSKLSHEMRVIASFMTGEPTVALGRCGTIYKGEPNTIRTLRANRDVGLLHPDVLSSVPLSFLSYICPSIQRRFNTRVYTAIIYITDGYFNQVTSRCSGSVAELYKRL